MYRTLEEARNNAQQLSPSAKEIAEEIAKNNGILNKPIKVRIDDNGTLNLIEGWLRYWGWIILYGPHKKIPTIIVRGAS